MEEHPGLAGQIALVCGATGRLGSEVALSMASSGTTTVVHFRHNHSAADGIVERITSTGGKAIAMQADLTDEESISQLVRETCYRFGRLDILVNTVHGQFDPKNVSEMKWEDWDVHLEALKSHFLLCRAAIPVMRGQKYGRIIYISGGLARRYLKGCSAYTTVKAGLNGFCKTLALEEGANGITVNIVAPGKVNPMDGRESTDHPQAWEELNRQSIIATPLGRYASTQDVSSAVLFFASPEASGITGQTLYVAAGEIMP